jgi:hypothetical protein
MEFSDQLSDCDSMQADELVICSKCKSKVHKDKIAQAFSKCSQVKDFVRRYENVQQLAGLLLIKQQQCALSPEDAMMLSKANKILNNEMAKKRYAQVLEKRRQNMLKKQKKQKKVGKTLEEKARLDEELVVPPLVVEIDDAEDVDTEVTTKMEE